VFEFDLMNVFNICLPFNNYYEKNNILEIILMERVLEILDQKQIPSVKLIK
jgi:hypothetical protein